MNHIKTINAGIEYEPTNEPPRCFKIINIPKNNYAVFTHCGPVEMIEKTYNQIYRNWLPYLITLQQWELMFSAGVRAHYVACRNAAQIMMKQQNGLFVNLSHWAAHKYSRNACYRISKAATDKFTSDATHDLRGFIVSVISIYSGLVRTERVMRVSECLDLSNSESPQYIDRVIAALYADPALMEKSRKALVAAKLGNEYGISDIDGKKPKPLSIKDA